MQFLFPTFLWALAALAIPIIIHLFYFRRFKRVYFSNVRFLREIKEETSARSRLRNLLVLAMRLLALAFLVLAFAQPFIPQDTAVKVGRKAVSVFVDNSFSMNALSEDVPLLEKAKTRARAIVQAYGVEDRFQILSNDFEGRHQRLVGQEEALTLIDELTTSPAVRELASVTARQLQTVTNSDTENSSLYLISDFQRSITDLTTWEDSVIDLTLVPLQAVQERNVGIDSAWLEAPVPLLNQNNRLLVRVRNYSDEELDNVRLGLQYEGQDKPEGILRIPARSFVIDSVNLNISRPGWQEATLSITDYPIEFDDKYYIAFSVAEKLPVLTISERQPNRFLQAALSGISVFEADFQLSQSLDYSRLSTYQLIVLEGLSGISTGLGAELQQYVRNGGNLLVFPGRNADIAAYRSFLTGFPTNVLEPYQAQERIVGNINTEEFVFQDVFENRSANLRLPVTQGNFPLSQFADRREEALLTYRDGSHYLTKYQLGQGNLYLCTAPLDAEINNLGQNAEVFIPMLYKMAISAARTRAIAYTIGEDEVIAAAHQTSTGEMVYKLGGATGEFIPEQRIVGNQVLLSVGNQIPEAGIFQLFLNADTPLDRLAFNYNRRESALDYYRPDELRGLVGDRVGLIDTPNDDAIISKIEERSQGKVLWRWCLAFVLLFLAIEGLLLRFWRT